MREAEEVDKPEPRLPPPPPLLLLLLALKLLLLALLFPPPPPKPALKLVLLLLLSPPPAAKGEGEKSCIEVEVWSAPHGRFRRGAAPAESSRSRC